MLIFQEPCELLTSTMMFIVNEDTVRQLNFVIHPIDSVGSVSPTQVLCMSDLFCITLLIFGSFLVSNWVENHNRKKNVKDQREVEAVVNVFWNNWRVYIPHSDDVIIEVSSPPSYYKAKEIRLDKDNRVKVTIDYCYAVVGLLSDDIFDHSIITLEETKRLRIDHKMEPLTPTELESNLYGPFTYIGIYRQIPIKLGIEVKADLYVQDRVMYPPISLGNGILAEYGFARKFDRYGSKLMVQDLAEKKGNYLDSSPLTFEVCLGKDSKSYRAKVHLTERVPTYVRKEYIQSKKVHVNLLCCYGPYKKKTHCSYLTIKYGDEKLKPVRIEVKGTVNYSDADIVLGTEFLCKAKAIVDYKKRALYLPFKNSWKRIALGKRETSCRESGEEWTS